MYEKGTLKLTWINKSDYTLLESKMFPKGALESAKQYAERNNLKDIMVFELIGTKNDEYEWRLLPYGSANKFLFHMKAQDSLIAWGVFIAIFGFSIYGMYKLYQNTK